MSTPITTQFKLPGYVVSNGQITGNPWSEPENILYVDELLTESNPDAGNASDIIIGGFNADLPVDAVITGIEMELIAKRGALAVPEQDLTIYALDNTSGVDVFYPYTAPVSLTEDLDTYVLGTSTYLFDTTWTVDQINNLKFELLANGDIYVDSFLLKVFYYVPDPIVPPDPTPGVCLTCNSPIQVQAMYLKVPFLAGQTKFYLQAGSFQYPDGTPVQPGDLGACGGEIDLVFDEGKAKGDTGNNSFEENVTIDLSNGFWQVLPSGVIEVDIGTVNNRGLQFHEPYAHVADLMSDHDANSKVIISNNGKFYSRYVRACQADFVFSVPITVKDEGTLLTSALHELDFVGAGVVATLIAPGKVRVSIPGGSASVDFTSYKFDTTVAGTPASAHVTYDNASPAATTQIKINNTDGLSNNIAAQLSTFSPGDKITLTSNATPANYATYIITANTNLGSVTQMDVTFDSSNGTFINDEDITLTLVHVSTASGIEVKNNGVSLGTFTKLNFKPGTSASDAGGGQADIDSTGGSGGGGNIQIDQTPDDGTYGLLAGDVDGINTTFTVSQGVYQSGKLLVYLNGLAQLQGPSDDWEETDPTTGTFDFITAPEIGDIITVEYQTSTGSTGESLTYAVAQTAHGLSEGDVIKSNGTANQYAKAKADSAVNAEVVGIVTTVVDVNNFIYSKDIMGYTGAGIPAGTPGEAVFLSPTTAGAMTLTEPTSAGQISKPVGVLIASGAKMNFSSDIRGQEVQATPLAISNLLESFTDTTLTIPPTATPVIVHTYTIPANTFAVGDAIRIKVSTSLTINASNGGGNSVKLDGNNILSLTGPSNGTQGRYVSEIIGIIKATTIEYSSTTFTERGGVYTVGQVISPVAVAFDPTIDQDLDFVVTNTTTNGGTAGAFDLITIEKV